MEHAQAVENIMHYKTETVFQQERTPNVTFGIRIKFVYTVTTRTFITWTITAYVLERIKIAVR